MSSCVPHNNEMSLEVVVVDSYMEPVKVQDKSTALVVFALEAEVGIPGMEEVDMVRVVGHTVPAACESRIQIRVLSDALMAIYLSLVAFQAVVHPLGACLEAVIPVAVYRGALISKVAVLGVVIHELPAAAGADLKQVLPQVTCLEAPNVKYLEEAPSEAP